MSAGEPLHPDQAAMWTRARAVLPRGVSSSNRGGWKQIFHRAAGAYVWDMEGTRYIDYVNAWGAIVLGHCDARINEAVAEASSRCDLTGVGPQLGEVELAESVCEVLPCADKVSFCTSGTDATMQAVQLSRAATGRVKILKFHGSYHGWNDHVAVGSARQGLASLSGSEMNTPNVAGLHPAVVADVVVVEWNDENGLRRAFDDHGLEIAAAITEGYVHSFGCVAPRPGFLELLRDLCTRFGAVMVMDEVKTGFRAALGGYQSICGVIPDLTAFGKAIGNGYALAGLAGTDSLMGLLGPGHDRARATIDGTYNATPYAVAAARKTLDIMRTEDVFDVLHERGAQIREGIAQAIADSGAPAVVTGLGSQWALYFRPSPPTNFTEALESDARMAVRYQESMLAQGILEPTFSGDRRVNAATTVVDVELTVSCVREALRRAVG